MLGSGLMDRRVDRAPGLLPTGYLAQCAEKDPSFLLHGFILLRIRQCRIIRPMLTVAETELFSRLVKDYWNEEERQEFAAFLATRMPVMWSPIPGAYARYVGAARVWVNEAAFG